MDNLPLNKQLKLHMLTITVRSVFKQDGKFDQWVIRIEINIRQMKIKNRPHYFFNDNFIVNIKDFDSSLLKIYKLSIRDFLVLIFTTLNKSQQKVLIV